MSASAPFSALTAAMPPKPAPTMTMRLRGSGGGMQHLKCVLECWRFRGTQRRSLAPAQGDRRSSNCRLSTTDDPAPLRSDKDGEPVDLLVEPLKRDRSRKSVLPEDFAKLPCGSGMRNDRRYSLF